MQGGNGGNGGSKNGGGSDNEKSSLNMSATIGGSNEAGDLGKSAIIAPVAAEKKEEASVSASSENGVNYSQSNNKKKIRTFKLRPEPEPYAPRSDGKLDSEDLIANVSTTIKSKKEISAIRAKEIQGKIKEIEEKIEAISKEKAIGKLISEFEVTEEDATPTVSKSTLSAPIKKERKIKKEKIETIESGSNTQSLKNEIKTADDFLAKFRESKKKFNNDAKAFINSQPDIEIKFQPQVKKSDSADKVEPLNGMKLGKLQYEAHREGLLNANGTKSKDRNSTIGRVKLNTYNPEIKVSRRKPEALTPPAAVLTPQNEALPKGNDEKPVVTDPNAFDMSKPFVPENTPKMLAGIQAGTSEREAEAKAKARAKAKEAEEKSQRAASTSSTPSLINNPMEQSFNGSDELERNFAGQSELSSGSNGNRMGVLTKKEQKEKEAKAQENNKTGSSNVAQKQPQKSNVAQTTSEKLQSEKKAKDKENNSVKSDRGQEAAIGITTKTSDQQDLINQGITPDTAAELIRLSEEAEKNVEIPGNQLNNKVPNVFGNQPVANTKNLDTKDAVTSEVASLINALPKVELPGGTNNVPANTGAVLPKHEEKKVPGGSPKLGNEQPKEETPDVKGKDFVAPKTLEKVRQAFINLPFKEEKEEKANSVLEGTGGPNATNNEKAADPANPVASQNQSQEPVISLGGAQEQLNGSSRLNTDFDPKIDNNDANLFNVDETEPSSPEEVLAEFFKLKDDKKIISIAGYAKHLGDPDNLSPFEKAVEGLFSYHEIAAPLFGKERDYDAALEKVYINSCNRILTAQSYLSKLKPTNNQEEATVRALTVKIYNCLNLDQKPTHDMLKTNIRSISVPNQPNNPKEGTNNKSSIYNKLAVAGMLGMLSLTGYMIRQQMVNKSQDYSKSLALCGVALIGTLITYKAITKPTIEPSVTDININAKKTTSDRGIG